jgi:hypothetical protein
MSLFATVLLVLLGGCDKDDGEGPKCTELSDLCHEADENGVEGAAECHDVAHDADEDACEEALAECEKTCAE